MKKGKKGKIHLKQSQKYVLKVEENPLKINLTLALLS